MPAISKVVALTGQADVMVVAVGSGTVTVVELATNLLKGFLYTGDAEVDLLLWKRSENSSLENV